MPVKIGNEVLGALSADRSHGEEVSLQDDLRLLTIIASTVSQAVRLRQHAEEELDRMREEKRSLQKQLKARYGMGTIVGSSKVMQDVYTLIDHVCSTSATVLILGESGVGKERVAQTIHYSSNRADQPFVRVSCAALPESLIESELFGHERGAFTGAVRSRTGRFEVAAHGTIFLDEIGDLPHSVQTKLLRVIQEREFERIGDCTTTKVHARIIAATNKNLEALLHEGKFREDLYYRLSVFPILVPPLRERKTDIMLLVDHFIQKYSTEHGKKIVSISTSATDMLLKYHWPGNVRELENCIERAIILTADGVIRRYHLPPNLQADDRAKESQTRRTFKDMIVNMERELITEELRRTKGNVAQAARALALTERIVHLKAAKYQIDPNQFKGR